MGRESRKHRASRRAVAHGDLAARALTGEVVEAICGALLADCDIRTALALSLVCARFGAACRGLMREEEERRFMSNERGDRIWVRSWREARAWEVPNELPIGHCTWCSYRRPDDKPNLILADGTLAWLRGERPHREGGLPAVVRGDGTLEWWRGGIVHREGGLPAIVRPDGTREWWLNDRPDRPSGLPTIEKKDGTKQWWWRAKPDLSLFPAREVGRVHASKGWDVWFCSDPPGVEPPLPEVLHVGFGPKGPRFETNREMGFGQTGPCGWQDLVVGAGMFSGGKGGPVGVEVGTGRARGGGGDCPEAYAEP